MGEQVAALRAIGRYGVATGLRTQTLPNLKTNVVTVRTEIFSDFGSPGKEGEPEATR